MRVLVLEPHAGGHHGPYLSWMVKVLAARGLEITVVTSKEAVDHPSVRGLKDLEASARRKVRLIASSLPFLRRREYRLAGLAGEHVAYWQQFRAWYTSQTLSARPDVVLLPYLDYCLYAIGLLGSPFGECSWVALAMRPSFHYPRMGIVAPPPSLGVLKEALFFRLIRNRYLRCLSTIDESLTEYLSSKAVGDRVSLLVKPTGHIRIRDPADAKRQLGIRADRKLVLVYGAITPRKGVVELLRALVSPDFPPDVDVLLAGVGSPEIRTALAAPWIAPFVSQGRLRLFDRFIQPEEEEVVFGAANIVWLGYRGHYTSSGVLLQAAKAQRPIIACAEGIIGWQTRRHLLGQLVDPKDTQAVVMAIKSLLDRQPQASIAVATARRELVDTMYDAEDVLLRAMGLLSSDAVGLSCEI